MSRIEINPELEPLIDRFKNIPVRSRIGRFLVQLSLRFRTPPHAPDRKLDYRDIKLTNSSARVYSPLSPSGVGVFWIHGGGLVIGNHTMDLAITDLFQRELGAVVLSAGYRLAPKHPFPAAIDDLTEAWHWLEDNADDLGIDKDKIIVAGMSAGGGLAAAIVQRLMVQAGLKPAAQSLLCPMLDDRTGGDRSLDSLNHLCWNNDANNFGWSAYLNCPAGSAEVDPSAVPARTEDLTGLPPTWIGVGTSDLFHAECVEYSRRLVEANVDTTLHEAPLAPHGFEVITWDSQLAKDYYASQLATLRRVLNL